MDNNRTRLFVVSSLVALAALASGCAAVQKVSGPSIAKPEIAITAVSMETFSERGAGGQLELNVANPNPVAMPLKYIEWEMSISGDRAVVGRIDVSGQIPANGSLPVSAALEVLAADAERVVPHLTEGMRDYQLYGVLHVATAKGDMGIRFQATGTL